MSEQMNGEDASLAVTMEEIEADDVDFQAALAMANLPTDDLDPAAGRYFAVRGPNDVPLAFGGYDDLGGGQALLRSIVVMGPVRGQGLGIAIVSALAGIAREEGVGALYLVTTSASGFFAKLGFVPIARADLPAAVKAARQLSGLCPDTATVMFQALGGEA